MDKIFCYLVIILFSLMVGCTSNSDSNDSTGGTTGGTVAQTGITGTGGAAAVSSQSGGNLAITGAGAGHAADAGVSTKNTAGGTGGKKLSTGGGGAGGSKNGGSSGKSGSSAAGKGGSASDACDRKCLIDYMTGYLEAIAAKDPSRIKVSSTLKFTNNGVEAKLGDGLWATASKLHTDKRLDYADPKEGQVGAQTVFDENGSTPVIYQTRLKIVRSEITEIESMEVRQAGAANGFFNVANMKPQPVWFQEIEPSKRLNREELKAVMELYMDYLEGKKRGADLPFDANCVRYENGIATASGVAAFNMQAWSFQVTRRHLVFDEEAGIVWGMYPFTQAANTLVVGEAFKIIEGKFMMIQAVMGYMQSKAWD